MLGLTAAIAATGAAAREAADRGAPPLRRAHAHNDYRHRRPLLDALAHGFTSVEADIYLVSRGDAGGVLLVGHDRDELRPDRTLEALYLDPLRERARRNGGRVFRDGPEVTLLVDIKSDGKKTYEALRKVLARYAGMLTVVRDGKVRRGAVRVVVSGNRPREVMAAETVRHAGYDGRLGDLERKAGKDIALFMPLVSDNWRTHFTWRGEGPMPAAERRRLRALVARAHARGQRVRFWATPEKEAVWEELAAAGVDLLNTDQLARLEAFLRARKARRDGGGTRKGGTSPAPREPDGAKARGRTRQ